MAASAIDLEKGTATKHANLKSTKNLNKSFISQGRKFV